MPLRTFSFNQDASCFVLGHDSGFRVYRTQPLALLLERDFAAEIPLVSMYFRTNIFALCSISSMYSRKKLVLWDDAANQQAGFAAFSQEVLSATLSTNFLAVAS
jgi:hypothetical protein